MESALEALIERLLSLDTRTSLDDWVFRFAASVIALFLFFLLKRAAAWLTPRVLATIRYASQVHGALSAVAPDSKGIWLSSPPRRPKEYRRWIEKSCPIFVVANLKGGVGKTTTAVNLAAHYAIAKDRKVLIIDLDFQGSATSSALSRDDRDRLLEDQAEGHRSKAASLIEGKDADWLRGAAEKVANVPGAWIIPSYYSLAISENRVMVEWLLGARRGDVRYHLAEVLHSELIQRSFDMIILDAPPRLTTACIQAFCAATHVLIPTVLDELSAEAVAAFADQLSVGQDLWPHLKIVGVLGTMTTINTAPEGVLRDNALNTWENDARILARDLLARALRGARPPLREASLFPTECFIPDKAALGRAAGRGIAYASPSREGGAVEVREAFDRLGF